MQNTHHYFEHKYPTHNENNLDQNQSYVKIQNNSINASRRVKSI